MLLICWRRPKSIYILTKDNWDRWMGYTYGITGEPGACLHQSISTYQFFDRFDFASFFGTFFFFELALISLALLAFPFLFEF